MQRTLKNLFVKVPRQPEPHEPVDEVSDLKCDFIAINDEADVQEFSENGYEVAGLEQPIDISDDDEAVAEIVGQFVIQNMYTEVVGGDDDDSVEAALDL